jgi:hypothetical protein
MHKRKLPEDAYEESEKKKNVSYSPPAIERESDS